jgi:predicted DNA-binding transcriptional regulator AlpA
MIKYRNQGPDGTNRATSVRTKALESVAAPPSPPTLPPPPSPVFTPYNPYEYIDTPTLADRLGVTVNCIERWRCQKKGPKPTYCGRRVRYLWADVLHWLAAGSR